MAWIINLSSIAAIVVTSFVAMALFERTDRGLRALAVLSFGVIAGIALAASGVMLVNGWAERMESFDFSGYEPMIDARRRVKGDPLTAIYYWPYLSVVLGALTGYAFGHHLYLRIRDRDLEPPES